MTRYLLTFAITMTVAMAAGWRIGRCKQNGPAKLSPAAAICLLGLGALWFLAAQLARHHADSDGFGATFAEWFAHTGKWFTLLAAILFGHGWILGSKQLARSTATRILYFVAVLGIVALIGARSIPVYPLLGDGQRDATGCLRQSKRVEVTCGAVALLNYLERYARHAPLTEREVSRVCGVTSEGTTTAALVNAARYFGQTNATARVLTLPELQHAKLPVIVSISTLPTVYHATLLIELDTKRARFIDPSYGFWEISRPRFEEIWYGKTVLLE